MRGLRPRARPQVTRRYVRLSPRALFGGWAYLGPSPRRTPPEDLTRHSLSRHHESAAEAMAEIRRGKVHIQPQQGNWVVVSTYWKSWPCLFPQHGPGKKHERPIVLTDWQLELVNYWPDQLVRGLIQSDGFRFQNTGRNNWSCPRYGFSQISDDIRRLFCYACDRWRSTGRPQANEQSTYRARQTSPCSTSLSAPSNRAQRAVHPSSEAPQLCGREDSNLHALTSTRS